MTTNIAIAGDSTTTTSGYLVPRAVQEVQRVSSASLECVVDTAATPIEPPDSSFKSIQQRMQPMQGIKGFALSTLRRLHELPNYHSRPYPITLSLPWFPDVDIVSPPNNDINNNSFISNISSWGIDYLLLLGCNQILDSKLINTPTSGVVNFHPAYLPEYRGVRACYWAAYEGVSETGITFHLINEEIDQGEAILRKRVPIPDQAGRLTIAHQCMRTAQREIPGIIHSLSANDVISTKSLDSGEYYSGDDYKGHGYFDPSLPVSEIIRRCQAEEQLPTTFTGEKSIQCTSIKRDKTTSRHASTGEVTAISSEGISVTVGSGEQAIITHAYYIPAWVLAKLFNIKVGDKIITDPYE